MTGIYPYHRRPLWEPGVPVRIDENRGNCKYWWETGEHRGTTGTERTYRSHGDGRELQELTHSDENYGKQKKRENHRKLQEPRGSQNPGKQ